MLFLVSLYTMLTLLGDHPKNSSSIEHKKITVTGIALNSKDCAILETEKGHYLLYDLEMWDEKYYGKKVRVTGRLLVKTLKKQSTDSVHVQERIGTVFIIKNPKWTLAE